MNLYALCDVETIYKKNLSIRDFIIISKKYNAKIIQYRDKINNLDNKIKNLLIIKSIFDGILIVNDEISLVKYCDGIHLGQSDIELFSNDKKKAISIIRQTIGNKMIGLSTHNKAEILEANSLDINYIGLGAYRKTSTKKDVKTIIADNATSLAKLSNHNVALIGGVKLNDNVENIDYNVICSGLL